MSGAAVRVGRLTALWLLAAALGPVGWISIAAAASTDPETTVRPPTLLWKSYPLKQRPSTTEQRPAGFPGPRQRSEATQQAAQAGSPGVQPFQNPLIVSALLATLVATMAAVLLMQSSVPTRVGGFRRGPDRARVRAPARRPSDPMPPRRTQLPPQEVTAQPNADPHAHPEPPAVSEPHRRDTRQPRPGVETCEIGLWRGYVKCQLVAAVRGSDRAFALSRYFRLRDEDAPGAGAQRALADLLVELERNGWTVVSEGPIWYQRMLQPAALTTQLEGPDIGPPDRHGL
jgi:hypothetical protein